MRLVARYCVVDAIRCQELMVKRNVISDYREVSTLAFVSLADSHFFAGGMKVKNLVGAYATQRGILVSMTPSASRVEGKYPGAYVFPPEKGLGPDPIRLSAVEDEIKVWRERNATQNTVLNSTCTIIDDLDGEVDDLDDDLDAAVSDAASATAANDSAAALSLPDELKSVFQSISHDRPVTGLDFSSLYPSIMMAYNLSPEKFVDNAQRAQELEKAGKRVQYVNFMFGSREVRGWFVGHSNVQEDIGLFPSILIDLFAKRALMKGEMGEYGDIIETINQVNNKAERSGGATDTVAAAKLLFQEAKDEVVNTEAIIASGKVALSPGSTLEEEINNYKRLNKIAKSTVKVFERLFSEGDNTTPETIKKIYDDAKFAYSSANAKQNALKVYMNTFYGEAGNNLSSLFLLELAGGVTSLGQFNIKLVADYVKQKGFHIKYGDTDSLYLVAPNKYFDECDMQFALGNYNREQWMSAMIRITMRALNQIRDEVNKMLAENNGTAYLKMAYEEVLYPYLFTGKKKYLGIPHLNKVDLNGKLFIRGIDIVKQGQSKLAVDIGKRIIKLCMMVENTKTVLQIVLETLEDAIKNDSQWEKTHFNMTATYKPAKQNVGVQTFVRRMTYLHEMQLAERDRALREGRQPPVMLYEPPEPGERFSYVIAKSPVQFDLRGRKIVPKKGEIMEFSRNVEPLNLQIDIGEYLNKFVVGICARFINSFEQFLPEGHAGLSEAHIDEKSQAAAKKFLEDQVRIFRGEDPALLKRLGSKYQAEFRSITKMSKIALTGIVGNENAHIFHGKLLNMELFLEDDYARILDSISDNIKSYVEWSYDEDETLRVCARAVEMQHRADESRGIVSSAAKSIYKVSSVRAAKAHQSPHNLTMRQYKGIELKCRANIMQIIPSIVEITKRYKSDIERIIHVRRNADAADQEIPELSAITDADKLTLDRFRDYWFELLSVITSAYRAKKINEELIKLRNKTLGETISAGAQIAEKNKILQGFKPSGIEIL
jgi:DNA polymerase elongation subunit (family B)